MPILSRFASFCPARPAARWFALGLLRAGPLGGTRRMVGLRPALGRVLLFSHGMPAKSSVRRWPVAWPEVVAVAVGLRADLRHRPQPVCLRQPSRPRRCRRADRRFRQQSDGRSHRHGRPCGVVAVLGHPCRHDRDFEVPVPRRAGLSHHFVCPSLSPLASLAATASHGITLFVLLPVRLARFWRRSRHSACPKRRGAAGAG